MIMTYKSCVDTEFSFNWLHSIAILLLCDWPLFPFHFTLFWCKIFFTDILTDIESSRCSHCSHLKCFISQFPHWKGALVLLGIIKKDSSLRGQLLLCGSKLTSLWNNLIDALRKWRAQVPTGVYSSQIPT